MVMVSLDGISIFEQEKNPKLLFYDYIQFPAPHATAMYVEFRAVLETIDRVAISPRATLTRKKGREGELEWQKKLAEA